MKRMPIPCTPQTLTCDKGHVESGDIVFQTPLRTRQRNKSGIDPFTLEPLRYLFHTTGRAGWVTMDGMGLCDVGNWRSGGAEEEIRAYVCEVDVGGTSRQMRKAADRYDRRPYT